MVVLCPSLSLSLCVFKSSSRWICLLFLFVWFSGSESESESESGSGSDSLGLNLGLRLNLSLEKGKGKRGNGKRGAGWILLHMLEMLYFSSEYIVILEVRCVLLCYFMLYYIRPFLDSSLTFSSLHNVHDICRACEYEVQGTGYKVPQ